MVALDAQGALAGGFCAFQPRNRSIGLRLVCMVAAMHRLGDHDSPGTEASPGYLTRFGAASLRS